MTNHVRFPTREIGSLAKPSWRVKTFAGRLLDEGDIAEAERWGKRLEVDGFEKLVEALGRGEHDLAEIDDWAARYALRLLERAGLDVVYDGEQRRTEMYDHVAAHARGFEERGTVRSFDNKYYTKAAVVEAPSADGPQDVDEYRFVVEHTDRDVKVPLTGRLHDGGLVVRRALRARGRPGRLGRASATRPAGASSRTWPSG